MFLFPQMNTEEECTNEFEGSAISWATLFETLLPMNPVADCLLNKCTEELLLVTWGPSCSYCKKEGIKEWDILNKIFINKTPCINVGNPKN